MVNDQEPQTCPIPLSRVEAQRLDDAVRLRKSLDATVSREDILREAVAEHLARLERPGRVGRDGRPNRSDGLFQFLFGYDAEHAFRQLSQGVLGIIGHAEALLEDASVLEAAKRHERAEFLAATAQEEMGKAYILIDMCRVDLARNQQALLRLCRSFYNHVLKHLYFDLSANDYSGIWELQQVQHYFRIGAQEWWPSSPESGEPDMPHEIFFVREANLYVDVDTHAQTWMVPSLPSSLSTSEAPFLGHSLAKAGDALARLRTTMRNGLLEPFALQVFNSSVKRLVITERTGMEELRTTYADAGRLLESELGVPFADFGESALSSWPMYWISR